MAWRTLTATLPSGETFQVTAETGVEFPGSERARIKDEYQTYAAQQGTTWQGLAIMDDDGDDLTDCDQAAEIEIGHETARLNAVLQAQISEVRREEARMGVRAEDK